MNIALLLSGGTGSRIGGEIPKQYIKVNGRSILSFCLETLSKSQDVDAIQIVAADEWRGEIADCVSKYDQKNKVRGVSVPGETRQLSIYNGLTDIRTYAKDDDVVLIHDAARPNLSSGMVHACFTQIVGHDGVLPVLPMKDTVYQSVDGKVISSLLDRSRIFAGQAPEAFVLGKYYEANERLLPDDIYRINGSTEPAIMAGLDVAMISGDENNYKITTQADLERFRERLSEQAK